MLKTIRRDEESQISLRTTRGRMIALVMVGLLIALVAVVTTRSDGRNDSPTTVSQQSEPGDTSGARDPNADVMPSGMIVNADGLLSPHFETLSSTSVIEGVVEDFRVLKMRDDPELPAQARQQEFAQRGQPHPRWKIRVDRWVRGDGPAVVYVQDASFDSIEKNENRNPFLVDSRVRLYVETLPELGPNFRRLLDGEVL